ncbi:hypothetical protein MM59RIKEN_08300 [Pusillibacter faecalis]|uniref:M23ase beta-sheet core domain-containing protein n=1 Tax=Pusillibacter faecalis TaxID=2714358 RepID=A0A810QD10_9FIRM|nr:M23 family metallopeptidase [Pusillibacter faecalis]BCK83511.1 hypothetical protein MM59RIKEN_08300 [Pusillibacter faecalis]
MQNNQYRKLLQELHVPAELNDRVLRVSRQQTMPARPRRVFRTAVCAACALALVVGTVRFYPSQQEGRQEGILVPGFSFGLTAYAADTGESYGPGDNGGLALASGNGMVSGEGGDYTGCLFQVTGENIQTISLSIDRGGLYRTETREITKEEMARLFEKEEQGLQPERMLSVWGESEDGPMYAEEAVLLGSSATEDYDPDARYGFWVPPEDCAASFDENEDLQQSAWALIDTFDGAHLTVDVTFADDSVQSRTYALSTGQLKVVYNSDGTRDVLPQLAGDDEPFVYGVYVVDEDESRWLEWPVQDSRTISLSNPYGEQENGTFHGGVDIPADQGAVILAAADGTVTETGFDAERGNYLILDHGDGLTTLYGQCRDVSVEEGATILAGEMIAAVGATGMATGPHLHFEVRQDGNAQNPVAYFNSDIRDTLRMG